MYVVSLFIDLVFPIPLSNLSCSPLLFAIQATLKTYPRLSWPCVYTRFDLWSLPHATKHFFLLSLVFLFPLLYLFYLYNLLF